MENKIVTYSCDICNIPVESRAKNSIVSGSVVTEDKILPFVMELRHTGLHRPLDLCRTCRVKVLQQACRNAQTEEF